MGVLEPLDAKDPAFIGPYRLLARLGEGGMGRVYLGMSAGRRVVAVKVIHADHARDSEFRDRFKVEVAAARKVRAAFTAPVIDAGEDDDPPWLVTSLVDGPSLADVIKIVGPLAAEPVWRLVAGMAEALAAVHACGIVHRDVSPGNVLLAIDGPRLIDFGLARVLGSSNMTATGIVIGTPAFLSPEHLRGNRVGPASDIFSLGSLMVFAATGAGPFGSGEPVQVLGRIMECRPDFRGLRGGLLDVAVACLSVDPADRPAPAEIIQSVPGDLALLADSPVTQFWPAQLNEFIRAYQASFAVVGPDQRGSGQRSTLPFKPPKEIAAEAIGLTEGGQSDDARHLLAAAAMVRPDQEVAALIAALRNQGRHGQAEVVIKAATRRPALEVATLAGILRQIGSGTDAGKLLDEVGDGSADHVGAIVVALADAGQIEQMHRLLRTAASTAARQPQAIVTLAGVLSSAGLGQEVTRLMEMVTTFISPAQAAALGDAMRGRAHPEAAFSLYSAAVDAVALRPPPDVASVLRFMRDEQQTDLADRLVEALAAAPSESRDVVQLAAALSSASLDSDARQLLVGVAAATPVAGVIEIAESLLAMNYQQAALSVCAEAAARDPSATGALAGALRDIGRPVDACRLLESLGKGAAGTAAEVIAGLRATGRSEDADRVLQAFLSQGPGPLCDLLARLERLGVSEDGSRIAALADPRWPGPLSKLTSALLNRQAYAVADHLLARAAQESAQYCCELVDQVLRSPPGERGLPAKGRLAVKGSNFPAPGRMILRGRRPPPRPDTPGPDSDQFELHWQAHDDHGGLLSCLRHLGDEQMGAAAHALLSYVARMPLTEAARFARELDWLDGPGGDRGQSGASWSGTTEAAALVAATTARTYSDVGTVVRALLDKPRDATPGRRRRAATELLSAIAAYPDYVVVTVAMGLNAASADWLATFVRITAGILPEILAGDVYGSRLLDTYPELLRAAGTNLEGPDFCHLYLKLKEQSLADAASFLLDAATLNPATPEIIRKMKSHGLRREARQLSQTVRLKNVSLSPPE